MKRFALTMVLWSATLATVGAAQEAVPLRYYGYSAVHADGRRTAYFLFGDQVLAAGEGAMLKGRWRVVQVGTDRVLVEDTTDKRQVTIAIEPEVKR